MRETLLSPTEWAHAELATTDLGDKRRTTRLVKLAAALAASPAAGTLPSALPQWPDLKAAYRLLGSEAIDHAAVVSPHVTRVREDCLAGCFGDRCLLLIEDTTSLDFTSHAATEGLGRIGDDGGRGLFLHTTLAVSIRNWGTGQEDDDDDEPVGELVGLFDQRCWARPPRAADRAATTGESKRSRLGRQRESQRWAACLEDPTWPPPPPPSPSSCGLTLVADREADIYETFARCRGAGVGWILRACQDRALARGEGKHVFDAAATAPIRCRRMTVKLRARPGGQKARRAVLQVRATTVTLRGPWRPGGWREPQPMNVVEAREVNAPAGAQPLRWVLLTSWPIARERDCRRVVRGYARRWLIEQYHKCLKTGCSAERSQLANAQALSALLGVLALVSLRLLDAMLLARARPDERITPAQLGPEALAVLRAKFGQPQGGWTHRTGLRAVARLGGFLARAGDGEPGWQAIWRGWQRLILLCEGHALGRSQ
jgi:transposase-like protein/transposase Tn5 family protein/DDE family transposase